MMLWVHQCENKPSLELEDGNIYADFLLFTFVKNTVEAL
jgi:hypothetical protein